MAIVFPTAAAAATQTPIYTFSPTSSPLANTVNNITYTYDVARGAWTAAGSAPTVIAAATLAEAAAGTLNTVYSSPETAVPKDAAGMTGAAILPSGTDAQRAAIATLVVGMQRYNTDSGFEEVYTGAATGWKRVAWANPQNITNDLTYSANTTLDDGVYVCRNLTINAGVTITTNRQSLVFLVYGDAVINGNIAQVYGPAGGNVGAVPGAVAGTGLGAGSTTASGNSYTPLVCLVGSGGSSGVVDTSLGGGVIGGPGGNGGGNFSIVAQGTITQGASSTIDCSGVDGGSPLAGVAPFRTSGSGGGSGGSIILQGNGNITVAGTLDVSGGNGGVASSNGGGAGGTGATGGSGGGGGVVILQTPATLTNTATINLAGGAVGASAAGTTPLGSGGGGSFGGVGGGNGAAGATGLSLTNGSPL